MGKGTFGPEPSSRRQDHVSSCCRSKRARVRGRAGDGDDFGARRRRAGRKWKFRGRRRSKPNGRFGPHSSGRCRSTLSNAPLKDVAASFQRTLGVPVALDTKALTDAGITGDTPISFVEPTISARMALDSMLAAKDMNWIVQRDLLIITTADVAKTRTVIRVYPVADLVFTETADAYEADFDSLIEVITSTLAPSSWDSNGGAGSVAPFANSGRWWSAKRARSTNKSNRC